MMKNASAHTGKLEIIERLRNSKNGNPRFLCRVAGWTCRTKPNDGIAYAIQNYDGQTVTATIGTYRGRAHIDQIWFPA